MQTVSVPSATRAIHRVAGLSVLGALSLIGAPALGGPHCFEELEDIDTYRSLVVHGGGGQSSIVAFQLPDGSDGSALDEHIPLDDPFWDHFSIDRTLARIAETDPTLPDDATDADIEIRVAQLTLSFLDTQHLPYLGSPQDTEYHKVLNRYLSIQFMRKTSRSERKKVRFSPKMKL